jgi:uroporphyrinogen-III synthase
MSRLNNLKVALLEARMSSELATLVRRQGGEPLCAPAVREATLEAGAEVAALLDRLSAGEIAVIFFLTGVGVKSLVQQAEALQRRQELLESLRRVTTVARGPKPSAALKQLQVPVSLGIQEPYTTVEILAALDTLSLGDKGVALLHYGERNLPLAEALLARGARLEEICLYEWQLPEDLEPLKLMIDEIIDGRVDAIAFTSQIQARHLFQVAAEQDKAEELREALNQRTTVAAVGPTCAAAIEAFGVHPQIIPSPPKMGQMILALCEYFEHKSQRAT